MGVGVGVNGQDIPKWNTLFGCSVGVDVGVNVHSQHGDQDDSILSAKLIRIAPETSSF